MAYLPKSPLWPEEADFLRILCYMKVDPIEARSIVTELSHLKPYLTQLEYDSDIDFLVLLNGITTKVVFTASDDRADLVSKMIRDICEAEGIIDEHNVDISCTPECATAAEQEEERLPTSINAEVTRLSPEPALRDAMCAIAAEQESASQGADSSAQLPTSAEEMVTSPPATSSSKAQKRRNRRAVLERSRDKTSQLRSEFSNVSINDSRRINAAMKNVNRFQASVSKDVRLAKRALTAKIKQFENFEVKIVKLLGHEAGELIPLQTFVSNMADIDWVRYHGVADKINRLMDRLLSSSPQS